MQTMVAVLALVLAAPAGEPRGADVATEEAAAPRVAKVVPERGAVDVDPAIDEIRVTFDTPMNRDGYSFTVSEHTFPQVAGAPYWVDAYTCAWPVNLKPKTQYGFGINGPSHKNFRSHRLVPVEPVVIHFTTGGFAEIKRSPEEQLRINVASFDELAEAVRERYAYRDLRCVAWEELFAEHRRRVVEQPTTRQWAQEAAGMLAAARDAHMSLELDGEAFATFRPHVQANFHINGVKKLVPNLRNPPGAENVAWGITEDGVGYLLIASWSAGVRGEINRVHAILANELADTRAMVIDVRPNGGGSETLARGVAGWFFEEPAVYAKHVYRRAAASDAFTPVRERRIEPNEPPRRFLRPVAVLMGHANMSSCEAFLLMMKQAPRVTLFGEASLGSSGNPRATFLPNGVKAMIPSWKALRPDGTCFEGEGIAPDVVVSSEGVDFSERDAVLAAALASLRARY